MVVVALLALAVPLMVQTTQNLTNDSIRPRLRTHDGGVLATRAAAHDVMAGPQPLRGVVPRRRCPSCWTPLMDRHGNRTPNPLVEHYPYLPGAFLVQIPFLVVGDALGVEWDPRLLVAILLVTGVVVARRTEAPSGTRRHDPGARRQCLPVTYGALGDDDLQSRVPGTVDGVRGPDPTSTRGTLHGSRCRSSSWCWSPRSRWSGGWSHPPGGGRAASMVDGPSPSSPSRPVLPSSWPIPGVHRRHPLLFNLG